MTTGPRNDLSDVAGLRVGHHHRADAGYLSGTTVVLAPRGGVMAGVDVRGGGPGTRETDLLHPTASVQRIDALVLTGGSAYGLAAAAGVTDELGRRGFGLPVGPVLEALDEPATMVVPIVPAAVLFDLGRGGDPGCRPDADFGTRALTAALAGHDARVGGVGAGIGAAAGGLKGGLGMASAMTGAGITVAALAVVNAAGSVYDPRTGELWGARLLDPADHPVRLGPVAAGELTRLRAVPGQPPPANTTLGVVATDARLDKAECAKLAGCAQDGLARAVNPVHTAYDGDTVFSLATGAREHPAGLEWFELLAAAADVLTRAVVRGLLAASTVTTPAGTWPAYLDLAPSARRIP